MSFNTKINLRLKIAAGATIFSAAIFLSGVFGTASSAYADAGLAAGGKAVVANTDGDNLRIRSGAGTDSSQIALAREGDVVSIIDGPQRDAKGERWFKVQAPSGTGWVVAGYLEGKDAGTVTAPQDTGAASVPAAAKAQDTAKPATAQTSKPAAGPKLVGFGRVANTDGDPLRVRSAASSNGDVLTRLAPDTSVAIKQGPVTDSVGIAWYQISANGVTGWVMAQYLAQAKAPDVAAATEPTKQAQQPAPAAPAAPVAQPAVEQPAAPAVAAPAVVAPAPTPDVVVQPAAQPAAQTATQPVAQNASATSGMPSGSVSLDVSSRASTLVNVAMRYVGYRYVFGGSTPSTGFDCSGFMYYVLKRAGYSIARDLYSQLNSGPRVSSKDLRPGDLLFFSNTYKPGLSHAGIYIGNGRFVHAENESTGVLVSDLWSAYYASHYTTAVRPNP